MKSTTSTQKSIQGKVKCMIENEYYATLSILEEQNEMYKYHVSATDGETEVRQFLILQIAGNKEAMAGYLLELREALKEAINTPAELRHTLSRLRNDAVQRNNEWIFAMFSEVTDYMELLSNLSTVEHPLSFLMEAENILEAA